MVNHISTAASGVSTAIPRTRRSKRQPSKENDYRERNKLAYAACEAVRKVGKIKAEVQLTFELIVKKCEAATFTTVLEQELADERGIARRTIQEHIRLLKEVGLLRIEPDGNLRRKCITAFDLNDLQDDPPAEMQPENDPDVLLALAAQETDIERGMMLAYQAAMIKHGRPASLFSPDLNDRSIVNTAQIGSSSSFKQDLSGDLTGAIAPLPPSGGGGSTGRRKGWIGREEQVPETPATRKLQEQGVEDTATLRRFADLDVAVIERTIADIKRRPTPPRNHAGFLVWRLSHARAAPDRIDAQVAVGDENVSCWSQVIAALDVPVEERVTWLDQTKLLDSTDGVAIVLVPNVFVRNEIRDRYAAQLGQALAVELEREITIELVIGGVQ